MLEVIKLSCQREEQNLFADVSFCLSSGQSLQIHGANGVGKSTLLRTLVGLHHEYRGTFQLQGEAFYIGHRHCMHPDLSVKQNLDYFAINAYSYSYFGIEQYTHTQCKDLSAGILQRVSLTRLLARQNDVWIIDEPFANLDPVAKFQLITLFEQYVAKGGSLLLVTHEAVNFGTSICLN